VISCEDLVFSRVLSSLFIVSSRFLSPSEEEGEPDIAIDQSEVSAAIYINSERTPMSISGEKVVLTA
jgi:hypothetical protein